MKQVFLASTLFQIAGLATGIDSGVYNSSVTPAASIEGAGAPDPFFEKPTERILLLSNNAVVLESTTPLDQVPGAQSLLSRFDRVIHLNDFLHPNHPNSWVPRSEDLPLWEATLRAEWELGDDTVELVVESPQVNPAIALGRIFHDALIRVHADGLMTYGPTRSFIPLTNGQRLTSMHYLPLVKGLIPRLLHEYEITPMPLERSAFVSVVEEIVSNTDLQISDEILHLDSSTLAIGFGQYLSALGILEPEEEAELHRDFITAAHNKGMRHFVFKPHPASPPDMVSDLNTHAQSLGMTFHLYDSPVIAEALVSVLKPALVVGGFSTALITARALFDTPAVAVGTELLLERVTPYHNSNRVPVTIVDAVLGSNSSPVYAQDPDELQGLVDSVCYAMQPDISFRLRDTAVDFLSKRRDRSTMKYFKKRRLTATDLPGGLPKRQRLPSVARKAVATGGSFARHYVNSASKNLRIRQALKQVIEN